MVVSDVAISANRVSLCSLSSSCNKDVSSPLRRFWNLLAAELGDSDVQYHGL